ncbi:MAG: hypothetical protein KKE12_08990, partial [Proteobacteria bacterium]|nr:hypothetical protein [Pseudomonadota bacterium]
MKKYLTSLITIVFYVMIFVVTTQTSVFALPVVDGFLGGVGEYANSFTTGWYNGHGKDSQFSKGGQMTTGYWDWESTGENFGNFYLYLAA